jgi:L-ascorbate 6-phosphate lactonase
LLAGRVMMATNGRALRERIAARTIPAGAVGVWWLGQASLVLKLAGRTIYVDPYLGPSAQRLVPPAFTPEQVTDADLVLLTHDHLDHIDPATLPGIALASPGARFVTPHPTVERVAELIGDDARIVAATAGAALDLGGLTLTPIAAKHEEFDEDPARLPLPRLRDPGRGADDL